MLFGPFMSIGSKKLKFLAAKASTEDLEFVIRLVEEGKIKPVIDQSYPLSEAAEAMSYVSKGHARGKVIISINPEK
jgi:NADPH:quinone reductase-like Zn-dependent oxidoreductase